ncbi:hemicentin-2-like isoform X2 [Xenia sp. Carnegie-2017]|uniref:hemicentin-2-like isoform X2 n=1 Tax=Xenia sp. Carnegie-2017 TaxID=2897299 RepID=UPI001F045E8A|nr:hemicentin-2-like isoform X2 [Xenia sp. Carnegie-2017]
MLLTMSINVPFMISTYLWCMAFFLPCDGVILSPPPDTSFTFLPGETHNITWRFDDDLNDLVRRDWSFTGSNGSQSTLLATVSLDLPLVNFNDPILPNYDVYKPSTLRLRNITHSYDGTYEFQLTRRGSASSFISKVRVFVAMKPNVTINNCSTHVVVNESDSVSCVCKGEGGNPPANVTWFDKDNNIIGYVGVVSKTLVIPNVAVNDDGNYTCKVQSYDGEDYRDEKSIKIVVQYRPRQTNITISPMSARKDQNVTISCESDGHPEPTYTISRIGTDNTSVVSNKKTYTIQSVNFSDAGLYRCEAKNELGIDLSEVKNLTVNEVGQNTPTSRDDGNNNSIGPTTLDKEDNDGPNIALIVGIAVGAVFLVAILVFLVIFCYRKSKQRKRHRDGISVKPVVGDNNYELDGAPGVSNESHYESVKDDRTDKNLPVGKSKPSDSKPPVYASINRENRQGNPLYSSLDPKDAPKRDPTQKRPAPTEYASIDISKLAPVEKKDEKKGDDKGKDEKKKDVVYI